MTEKNISSETKDFSSLELEFIKTPNIYNIILFIYSSFGIQILFSLIFSKLKLKNLEASILITQIIGFLGVAVLILFVTTVPAVNVCKVTL